ncbi:hypothetical protein Dimus_025107 [Dionaea muscipula]
MEMEAKRPASTGRGKSSLVCPTPRNLDFSSTTCSSSSNSSSSRSTSPVFLRNVQAAFKRHRSLATTETKSMMPRRVLPPQLEKTKGSSVDDRIQLEVASLSQAQSIKNFMGQKKDGVAVVQETRERASVIGPRCVLPLQREKSMGCSIDNKRPREVVSRSQTPKVDTYGGEKKDAITIVGETQTDASITPPSLTGTITSAYEENYISSGAPKNEHKHSDCNKEADAKVSTHLESQHALASNTTKKVQFALTSTSVSHGSDVSGMDNLSSHIGSLALTEMEWDMGSQAEMSNLTNNEPRDQISKNMGIDDCNKRPSLRDQLHDFRNFLRSDVGHPVTQSSYDRTSCVTTTSVHATSAPMLNSTTNCSSRQGTASCAAVGSSTDAKLNSLLTQVDRIQQSSSPSVLSSAVVRGQLAIEGQPSNSVIDVQVGFNESHPNYAPGGSEVSKEPSPVESKSMEVNKHVGNDADVVLSGLQLNNSSSDYKLEPSKVGKVEKTLNDKGAPAPRKKHYDPDLFFKVNGKLYQRIGKIGSGGSSEVHKVISAECMIYALKKIKLKGRDYATAYGFCQEILYLNKLKGKSNIIQLIDYEVTDKALLQEVMNGSMNHKDGKVKDDRYIYMVLEYGEIDLAHMLSQKWKELECSDSTIDENWLRFYWQQILQAVNTIHEERIVHSDLKPANFLLVKGSLKLIDFGIAKAIMNDTTNIQRDSQVGTLSYMSPEAFMCNESDANGNVIKCGRSSDIWSLGCILYQMVYGRTPFSEYKTFWAKFKVITDPNHEITYAPVSNPCLLDLMKKCLAWDRNERWRIPQLLQHPFIAPPPTSQPSLPGGNNCKAVQMIAESFPNNHEASTLCCELQQLLAGATPASLDEQCTFLSQVSTICLKLQEHISNTS